MDIREVTVQNAKAQALVLTQDQPRDNLVKQILQHVHPQQMCCIFGLWQRLAASGQNFQTALVRLPMNGCPPIFNLLAQCKSFLLS